MEILRLKKRIYSGEKGGHIEALIYDLSP